MGATDENEPKRDREEHGGLFVSCGKGLEDKTDRERETADRPAVSFVSPPDELTSTRLSFMTEEERLKKYRPDSVGEPPFVVMARWPLPSCRDDAVAVDNDAEDIRTGIGVIVFSFVAEPATKGDARDGDLVELVVKEGDDEDDDEDDDDGDLGVDKGIPGDNKRGSVLPSMSLFLFVSCLVSSWCSCVVFFWGDSCSVDLPSFCPLKIVGISNGIGGSFSNVSGGSYRPVQVGTTMVRRMYTEWKVPKMRWLAGGVTK